MAENATRHGLRRFRKRLGLPARAADRFIRQAWDYGLLIHDMPGWLQLKVLTSHDKHLATTYRDRSYRYYHGYLFIFDSENQTLITVYPVADNDNAIGWLDE
jgi:hypothetical protein